VLGLDRFVPPHEWGSSHGETRIIREAYFEHPLYVPLVQRAYELWAELEQAVQRPLYRQTGGLMIGPPGGQLVSGALRSAQVHGLHHELLTTAQVRRRFPIFNPRDKMMAVWEPRAGVLFPEVCITAHLTLATQQGATLQYDETVLAWKAKRDGVLVTTTRGQYRAARLLLTAGAWMGQLVPELASLLTVERQVLLWFEPLARPSLFSPDRCPIFILEHQAGRHFYGFPDLGQGVKVAIFHEGETADPDALSREVKAAEVAAMQDLLAQFVPNANGRLLQTATCMFTNSPDFHFLIDFHPFHPQVLIASPCSGHGFKFASAIGEMLADLLTTGQTTFDTRLFRLERLRTEQE
jgi:sarcosine oxidase